ncbi:MAG: aminotransferase class I/II-fold pyridoxal phosphate-dependent enzyme [Deltaproteobacteria bacterium]|jgi:threonine-phosphate decarboxylase|nr:aminotransferase class I/II-fold pyridoxal phosphate-dependent enzyme [Deltaproteobacteria bacterium]
MTDRPKHPHGGRVEEAAKNLGLAPGDILDFSANINPQGPPRGLRAFLASALGSITHYPEIDARSLTESLAANAGLPAWSILAAAGTTPLIHLLASSLFHGKNCVLAPAFSGYEDAFGLAWPGAVHFHPLNESTAFLLTQKDTDGITGQGFGSIILANPANPTGRLVPPECLHALLRASTRQGFWLIVDEAFMGFCGRDESLEGLILDNPRLIVLKSMTKLFAIPGLRLGYMACGNRQAMETFSRRLEPWAINSLAQKAGPFLLAKKAYAKKTPKITALLRDYLTGSLSPYFDFLPSDCNFVMASLKGALNGAPGPPTKRKAAGITAAKKDLIDYLYGHGILIRDLDGISGLRDGYVRLAVRPKNEVDRLRQTLEAYHAQAR